MWRIQCLISYTILHFHVNFSSICAKTLSPYKKVVDWDHIQQDRTDHFVATIWNISIIRYLIPKSVHLDSYGNYLVSLAGKLSCLKILEYILWMEMWSKLLFWRWLIIKCKLRCKLNIMNCRQTDQIQSHSTSSNCIKNTNLVIRLCNVWYNFTIK